MQENISKNRISFRLAEISELTGVSIPHLRNEITRGKLRVRKLGRAVVVLQKDLEMWLNNAPETV